jgi:hypothetical protein
MVRIAVAFAFFAALAQDGNQELRRALEDEAGAEGWVYDDYAAGVALARKDGRPLLVVFR